MLGIGFWEMLVIAVLILIAVGPDRLPSMVKTVAKFYRQFRRTADDLRASTGIDDLLRDEELKELAELRKQKLSMLAAASPKPKPALTTPAPAASPPVTTAPVTTTPVTTTPVTTTPVTTTPVSASAAAASTISSAPTELGPTRPVDVASRPNASDPELMLGAAIPRTRAGGAPTLGLDAHERSGELPPEGVDVHLARSRERTPTDEDVRLRKARIASKVTGRSVEELLAEDTGHVANAEAS